MGARRTDVIDFHLITRKKKKKTRINRSIFLKKVIRIIYRKYIFLKNK